MESNTKQATRALLKATLSRSKERHPEWSNRIWANLDLKRFSKIGAYAPLKLEPIIPINPDFLYPKILNETEMTYGDIPDVVLIPGIGFSETLYRLGRGKGYFDRYLKNNPSVYSIGLAFEIQVSPTPTWELDAWDMPLNEIITENRRITHGK